MARRSGAPCASAGVGSVVMSDTRRPRGVNPCGAY